MPPAGGRGFSPAVKRRQRGALAPEAASLNLGRLFMRWVLLNRARRATFAPVPCWLPTEKPICAEMYLSLCFPRILVNRGAALSDGTFSIVFVKQNVRASRAACGRPVSLERRIKPGTSSAEFC